MIFEREGRRSSGGGTSLRGFAASMRDADESFFFERERGKERERGRRKGANPRNARGGGGGRGEEENDFLLPSLLAQGGLNTFLPLSLCVFFAFCFLYANIKTVTRRNGTNRPEAVLDDYVTRPLRASCRDTPLPYISTSVTAADHLLSSAFLSLCARDFLSGFQGKDFYS